MESKIHQRKARVENMYLEKSGLLKVNTSKNYRNYCGTQNGTILESVTLDVKHQEANVSIPIISVCLIWQDLWFILDLRVCICLFVNYNSLNYQENLLFLVTSMGVSRRSNSSENWTVSMEWHDLPFA